MGELQRINPDWTDEPCVVAAPGPSLTPDVVSRVRYMRIAYKWRAICVNDAYRLMPWADAMFASDLRWWRVHKDCNGFAGERWSTHVPSGAGQPHIDDKAEAGERWGVRLVAGRDANTFSTNPHLIHYGSNSGFQAINLAILKGCRFIVLVGFDMRRVNGQAHFFGEHPPGVSICHDYSTFLPAFNTAAGRMPDGVEVVNATPGSALKCFTAMNLDEAVQRHSRLHRNRSESVAAAG